MRISKLEQGQTRLETLVGQLAAAMDADNKARAETRREDRDALRELVGRMERSVVGLADEMKKLADRNAAVDASVLAKQSQASGAVDTAKYIIGTLLVVAGIAIAYQEGKHSDHAPPEGYYEERAR